MRPTVAKKRLHSRRPRKPQVEFILEPGQSLNEFNKLKRIWDKKLKQAGHADIEFISQTGRTSRYFQGYNSQTIGANFSEQTLEYFRRCGLFLHHANFKELFSWRDRAMNYWLWTLWCDGLNHQEITDRLAIKARQLERRRVKPRLNKQSKSIYWVHGRIKAIEAIMFTWFESNKAVLEDE